jgi:hypothetical protein
MKGRKGRAFWSLMKKTKKLKKEKLKIKTEKKERLNCMRVLVPPVSTAGRTLH